MGQHIVTVKYIDIRQRNGKRYPISDSIPTSWVFLRTLHFEGTFHRREALEIQYR